MSAASPRTYIYAIGNLRPSSPSVSAAEAFSQLVAEVGGSPPDFALPFQVYSQDSSLWLTKELCWVMEIEARGGSGSTDTYLIRPRSFQELYGMVDALAPDAHVAAKRYDVVIGPLGSMAPPEMCSGTQLPIVVCNQLYSFTYDEFVAAVSVRVGVPMDDVGSMFYALTQIPDNAGQSDEHRAINYLTLRYPDIYVMASNMLGHGVGPYLSGGVFTLESIDARPATVQGTRRIVDVIFQYENRTTPAKVNWYCQVDTTGQFPFLVRPLSRYFQHS